MPITFPFYNVGLPTPSTKNTINNIAGSASVAGIRDFLLFKNLFPISQPLDYQNLSTTLNGSPKIGQPFLDTSVNGDVNGIPNNYPIETYGITFKNLNNVSLNQFKNTDNTSVDALIDIPDFISKIPEFGNAEFPQGANSVSYPEKPNELITKYGLLAKTTYAKLKETATIKNLYNVTNQQIDIADYIDDPKAVTDYFAANKNVVQGEGYLDQYGALNQGGGAGIQAANILGSIAGGGLGVAKTGIVTSFDLRASLVGRVLGATGSIKDTNIGVFGGQQLALALANNAAFNVQQDILGKLNLQDNVLSLIKGNGLAGFRPNYQITVPESGVGKFFEGAASILGFTLPKSFVGAEGSIFASENGYTENIARANALIVNTGKGQFTALIKNANASLIGTGGYDDPTYQPFRSGYAPGYRNSKGEKEINGDNIYAFSNGFGNLINPLDSCDGIIPDISYEREGKVSSSGFRSDSDDRKDSDTNITWVTKTWVSTSDEALNKTPDGEVNELHSRVSGVKKSLLDKTQKLFNSVGMLNMVTVKGDMKAKPSQIQTTNGRGISKGSAVLRAERYDLKTGIYKNDEASADDTYCRSWTTINRYDTVNKMIRHKGLSDVYPYKTDAGTIGTVLDDNGFVKIAPYSTDVKTDPKKFMFSIENLAWHDNYTNLLPCERGPGDKLSGKHGRIMWFPPYDIQFTENTSVNWESNNFIGRGESVYTYNNTERSGTLSFKMVVDHSSYTNSFRGANGPDDNYVASFMAGCIDPDSDWADKLTLTEKEDAIKEITIPEIKVAPIEEPPPSFTIYFPNDNANVPAKYEDGLSGATSAQAIDYSVNKDGKGFGLVSYQSDFTPGLHNNGVGDDTWPDNYNYGLNSRIPGSQGVPYNANGVDVSYSEFKIGDEVAKYLKEKCNTCVVKVTGYASNQGSLEYNQKLANARRDVVLKSLKEKCHLDFKGADKEARFKAMPSGQVDGVLVTDIKNVPETTACKVCSQNIPVKDRMIHCPPDSLACKSDRKVIVTFESNPNLAPKDITDPTPKETGRLRKLTTKITNRLYRECDYFDKLTQEDSFVFDRFREKIRYFHPAFHSTTPEGLNSRLTFLNQCTRQGPTMEGKDANNLAFGRAPICILRIGDFYNTKIIIDSLGIDYEPLVWDLNPEGIGVQPMIANVSISFKFIGGSTLLGPINKLQNALSFNYYANTQVYDPRADYIAKRPPQTKFDVTSIADGAKEADGNTRLDTAVVKALRPYYLVDGYQGSMEDLIITTETPGDIINNTPLINQEAANDNATSGVQEEALPTEAYKIGGFTATYDGKSSDADAKLYVSNFFIKIKWFVYNTADAENVDVNVQRTILDELYKVDGTVDATYKISIKDINSSEIYEEIVSKDLFIAYTEGSIMNVPITNGTVPSSVGLRDSLGKETFEISLVKTSTTTKEVIKKQSIKLK